MNQKAIAVVAIMALLTSNCATLLKGTTDEITVISDPSGATVVANDSNKGTTPVTFTVRSKDDLNVRVSKEGYRPQDFQNPASFRWGWEIWAFIAYIIPMVVDLASGAAWGHDRLTMTAHLDPVATPTLTPAPTPAPPAAAEPPSAAASTPSGSE